MDTGHAVKNTGIFSVVYEVPTRLLKIIFERILATATASVIHLQKPTL